ncbi:hypothetical protein HRbin01_01844 [archaeon HR01]|nr:hypothetical protein HRbin01_01844 [archaeon HR01]
MPHHIELFSAGCPLCRRVEDMLLLGKCAGCKLEIYDLSRDYQTALPKIDNYRIKAVPTVVIDGRIRIEGLPQFSFICGEELYSWLDEKYPLSRQP